MEKQFKPQRNRYEIWSLMLQCRYVWGCPVETIVDWYQQHISNHHLDIGVGTGVFLEHCELQAPAELTLLDFDPAMLDFAAARLQQHEIKTVHANILHGLPEQLKDKKFDSVALNFFFHHQDGEFPDKAPALEYLKPCLNSGATIFGATILGRGVERSKLARYFLKRYNQSGQFSNKFDCPKSLHKMLGSQFSNYEVHTVGNIAFFKATAE